MYPRRKEKKRGGGWEGKREEGREALKLKSMNGNILGNYRARPALCGEESGGNVKMADNKTASKGGSLGPSIRYEGRGGGFLTERQKIRKVAT